jgi:hypothetical protein
VLKWDVNVADVARLEPSFRDDVTTLLAASPYDWRIVYAYRSIEVQTVLYDKYKQGGPLAAPPGKSAHNYGLAVDVQLWVPDAPSPSDPMRMEWNVKAPGWQWLFVAVHRAPRLHSGISFGDFDHIERLNWKLYRDWAGATKPSAGADV